MRTWTGTGWEMGEGASGWDDERFRECGFSKWGKEFEPGPVRDMWFEMFRNVSFHVRLGWKLYVLQRLRFISVILYHQ